MRLCAGSSPGQNMWVDRHGERGARAYNGESSPNLNRTPPATPSPVKTRRICINFRSDLWKKGGGHVHPSPPRVDATVCVTGAGASNSRRGPARAEPHQVSAGRLHHRLRVLLRPLRREVDHAPQQTTRTGKLLHQYTAGTLKR